MAPHSRTLGLEDPMDGGACLQSMGLLRVEHDWATSLSLSCIGEGNGNPLQCSCLENPRDKGDWWTALYGVTQSRTRLKRLSSSSSDYGLFTCSASYCGSLCFWRKWSTYLICQTYVYKVVHVWKCVNVLVTQLCWLFVTPWTVACLAPLYMGILQPRILEYAAIPVSRGISWPRDWTGSPALQADSLPTVWVTREA